MTQVRFKFTGEPKLPKADSKKPFCKLFKKDNKDMASMNIGIQESKGNMGFVECFGTIVKTIKTKDKEGNDIEVDWSDRFDEKIVKDVANYRKYVVDLGEEFGGRKEFITQYDAILYLKENLPNYTGKISVSGQMEKEWYQDKYYDKFKFQNLYAVDDEHKNRLLITADIYYRKDCIDTSDWKEEKKIYIDGYISQFINKDEGTKFIPQRFVFNGTKYYLSDEQVEKYAKKRDISVEIAKEKIDKLLKYKLKYIQCDKKKWHHLLWDVTLQNGAEEIEFDESQLTAAQREQIELGIRKLDDFKPNGAIMSQGVHEYRLYEPQLKRISEVDDFSDGLIDAEISDKDFEEACYVPAKPEKMSDVINEAEESEDKSETEVEIDDDDLDDLFD